jgi:hypothetical protein
MSTNLTESKSLLAKLLAAENITVLHLPVKTASFNVKTRILTCPIWQDMTGDLYDLLMGHEIGHALYTPSEKWESVAKEKGAKFQGFLNVCEDARIEKLVKRRFPGIRKPFIAGYKTLLNRDFFGVKKFGNDFSPLNLLDRINLAFKCGSSVAIRFNDEERVLVKELENVETWEEVVKITQKIWDYVKEKEEDKINNQQDMQNFISGKPKKSKEKSEKSEKTDKTQSKKSEKNEKTDEDDNDESDSSDGSDDSDNTSDDNDNTDDSSDSNGDSSDVDSDDGDDSGDSDDSGSDSDSDDSDDRNGGNSGGEDEEGEDLEDQNNSQVGREGSYDVGMPDPESLTDRSFRENEEQLIDKVARPYIFLDIPECDLKKTIIPNATIVDFFEAAMRKSMRDSLSKVDYDLVSKEILANFHKQNIKYISLLVKEFEMRKNAHQYSRQLESKTGELDMRKISQYKFNNNIFRKMVHTPKGKDHGMIMFVDMSISMVDVIRNTMEQAIVLAMFCKKVGIPFEVYGFSDSSVTYMNDTKYTQQKFTAKTPTAFLPNSKTFHLKSLINSDLSPRNFNRAAAMMIVFAMTQDSNSITPNEKLLLNDYRMGMHNGNMNLSGTPFIETVIASRSIIKAFKEKTRAEIINVIYLTDGEGGMSIKYPDMYRHMDLDNSNKYNIGFVDPITKVRVMVENGPGNQVQAALTRLIRLTTECLHIGFFVGEKRTLQGYAKKENLSNEKMAQIDESIDKNGFFKIVKLGYDSYYYVETASGSIKDISFKDFSKAETNAQISEAFAAIQRKKASKRAMVTSFASEIAV